MHYNEVMLKKFMLIISALVLCGCALPSVEERDMVYTQSAETQAAVEETVEAEVAETAAAEILPTETPVPTVEAKTDRKSVV